MKTQQNNSNFTFKMLSKVILILSLIFISTSNLKAVPNLEVTGNISELGADYLIVQGYTFYVDQNTEFRGRNGNTVTFSYFQLNDFVEVKGNSIANGNYLATRVKLQDGLNNPNEIELTGYVTNIGTNSFIINNITFNVNENTVYKGRHGNPFSFDQIQVGMLLEVKASLQGNSSFLATRVKTEDDDNHHGNELELKGFIENKSSNSITVAQKEFFVNSTTVILDINRMPISFADLNIYDRVEVKAFKQSDNTFLALRIKKEDIPENEIEFTAQIENIVGNEITINGVTFNTDSNTVFLDDNRMPVTIDFLRVGMWVEVKGFKKQNGSYYASRIQIEDFVRNEIEVKGKIFELTSSYFVVGGITFNVDSTTLVLDHMNNPIAYSSLQVNQLVEVHGVRTGVTSAKAVRIKIEGIDDIEIFGRLTAINFNSIELNGLIIFVNSNTIYLNHANQLITFGDLSVNQFVEVKMVRNTDSSLLALRIKIEDGMNFSKVNGFVGIVSGSSIQLPTGSYSINPQTVVIDNNFSRINTNQLSNGQQVIIWASVDALSNNTALQIQSKVSSPTGIEESPALVDEFILEQNYPNPFNPSTTISFTIQADQFVSLRVYNTIGEEVKTLVNENLTKGTYKISFNAGQLSSGLYLYRLETGGQMKVRKMMLLK